VSARSAQTILGELTGVPGVVGALWCRESGDLAAQAFPAEFDADRLGDVAAALSARTRALEAVLGSVGTMDVRYAAHRVVVRPTDGGRLLFFCSPQVNLELLSLWASGAAASLAHLEPPAPPAPPAAPPAPAAGGRLWEAVQRIQALIERAGQDPVILRGRIALQAGFPLDLVEPGTPDDPAKLQRLRAAASAVLGQSV
jgi:predicted regulator of Ras-like GTPase activity (Roadblock/LC7/MglB family)